MMRTGLLVVVAVISLLGVAGIAAADPLQSVRPLSAAEFNGLYGGIAPQGEANEVDAGGNKPWLVRFTLPWDAAATRDGSRPDAFTEAAARTPAGVMRFGEVIVNDPRALAVADLINAKLPFVAFVNGQRHRVAEVPPGHIFGDRPFARITVKELPAPTHPDGTPMPTTEAAAMKDSNDLLMWAAGHVPAASTFAQHLDYRPVVPSALVATLGEITARLTTAPEVPTVLDTVAPAVAGPSSAVIVVVPSQRLGVSAWALVAANAAGAQLEGRGDVQVLVVDAATADDSLGRELGIQGGLRPACKRADGSEKAVASCFHLVTAQPANKKGGKFTFTVVAESATDVGLISAEAQKLASQREAPAALAVRAASISGAVQARAPLYHRALTPAAAATSGGAPSSNVEGFARRVSTWPQFRFEIETMRAGLTVLAFVRGSDRAFGTHRRALDELAATLYREREAAPGQPEVHYEVLLIDAEHHADVAKALRIAAVPSLVVVHHLGPDQPATHALIHYQGEISVQGLPALLKFLRKGAFERERLVPVKLLETPLPFNSKRTEGDLPYVPSCPRAPMAPAPAGAGKKGAPKPVQPAAALAALATEWGAGVATETTGAPKPQKDDAGPPKSAAQVEREQKAAAARQRKAELAREKIANELEAKKRAKEARMRQKADGAKAQADANKAANAAKLKQIEEDLASGKRTKKITKTELAARRKAMLKGLDGAKPRTRIERKQLEERDRMEARVVPQFMVKAGDGGEGAPEGVVIDTRIR